MATIKKKIWPEFFKMVKSGKKKVELRVADFKIKAGDTLVLQEWNPKTKNILVEALRKKRILFGNLRLMTLNKKG